MARANYLTTVQFDRLRDWGVVLRNEIGHMPYLVGSVLTRPDWRDVDVRIIVDDAPGWFGPFLADRRGNFLLSMWGQTATGLPIDCQFQTRHEANAIDGSRHPIGVGRMSPRWLSEAAPGRIADDDGVCLHCGDPSADHSLTESLSCAAALEGSE